MRLCLGFGEDTLKLFLGCFLTLQTFSIRKITAYKRQLKRIPEFLAGNATHSYKLFVERLSVHVISGGENELLLESIA